jgi:hypothetical protein
VVHPVCVDGVEMMQTALPVVTLTESVPAPPTMQLLPPLAEIVSAAELASTSVPPVAVIEPVPRTIFVSASDAHSDGLRSAAPIARVFFTAYDTGTVALAVNTEAVAKAVAATTARNTTVMSDDRRNPRRRRRE